MLVDSHCHLHMIDYEAVGMDLSTLIQTAIENGVEQMLCVSTTLQDTEKVLNIAEAHRAVVGSIGLHPNESVAEEPTVEQLITLAAPTKIVAIGETGLDYYRLESDPHGQVERFITHIEAAKKTLKPLIIHTRQARKDTLAILQAEKAGEVGGVLHCFTEDWDTAAKALDLGFYISFSGIITFKNAAELQMVAKKIPLDKFLIETDAPYLAPVPHRGKINHPMYVKYVAECIAHLKGMSFENIAHLATKNFYQLFSYDK